MLKSKELWLVLSVGLPLGLVVGLSNTPETAGFSDEQAQRPHESEQELLQAQAMQEARQQDVGRSGSVETEELQQPMVAAEDPAQRAAQAILTSGRPLTLRQISILSQIANREPSQMVDNSIYESPRYVSAGASTGSAAPLQGQSLYRTPRINKSLSFAGQQRLAIQEQSQRPADSGASAFDNSGATNSDTANGGAINVRTGQYYAPAGPGGYVDPQNGTYYAQSGPNGVVNTRTGEHIPVTQ